MLFTSFTFIGFVCVLFLLYYALPKKCQWLILLAGSLAFYMWGGPKYIIYLLVTSFTTWFSSIQITNSWVRQKKWLRHHAQADRKEKNQYKNKMSSNRVRWMTLCIVLNIVVLAVVKYSSFALDNINHLLANAHAGYRLTFISLAQPMGISFYMFMAIGYLVDVKKDKFKAVKNPLKLLLFLSFFPAIVQGPINRFGDVSESMFSQHDFSVKEVTYGVERMLWGFFKKMVIADRLAGFVATVTGDPSTYTGGWALAGMILYTIELYADFTGGIDITIGTAQLFGVKLQENFIRPYFSRSLKEYWRRWHISMSSWFRDYMFYPISMSRKMQHFSRWLRKHVGENIGRKLPVYLSSFIVWLATGIWHGASWNFILWGVLNFLVLMISEELEPLYDKFHQKVPVTRAYEGFEIIRTVLLIAIMNMFDCYASVRDTVHSFFSIFSGKNYCILADGSFFTAGLSAVDLLVVALGCLLMFMVSMKQRRQPVRDQIAVKPVAVQLLIWCSLFLVIAVFGAYGIGYDASQFIYNRF
ncbi:MBOAT family O-acyltransferase [Lactimicrobium massiliense]|uniref:MBOAT family O-acyltransferase n=1 Tax=Lactimicrobium massiliense TaxID=2161814 RepID=UPI000D560995|nr:MBOAT family O-acyltransferase [Lactimicrobium massiliense]